MFLEHQISLLNDPVIFIVSSSISYKYPRTTGAAYPTKVPHSQPDTAGSPTHMDPSSQSHVAN